MTETSVKAPLPRAFWALWAAQLVNRIGGFVQPFLVLYLTQEQHLSASTAGVVVAAVGAGSIVSQVLGGWLTDHVGRRRTMVIGFLGTAAAMVALGTASTVWWIGAAAFATGVLVDLFRPAANATVADLLPPKGRVRAYGLLFWAVNLGFSVSTVAAGVIASHGFGLLFWMNAATCVTAAVILRFAVPETRPALAEGRPRRRLLPVAARDGLLIALILVSTAFATLYFQAYATLPLSMAGDGLSTSTYGLVIALNGATIVVVQPFAVRVLPRFDRGTVLAVSLVVVGLGLGLGGLVDGVVGYAASVVIWSLGEIGATTVLMAVFADLAPVDLRGGYLGLAGMSFSAGQLLAPLVGTAVYDAAGPGVLWAGCAALGAMLCVVQLALGPALRRRATRDADADPDHERVP